MRVKHGKSYGPSLEGALNASGKSLKVSSKTACVQVVRLSVKVSIRRSLQSNIGTRKLSIWITEDRMFDARASIRTEQSGQMSAVSKHAMVISQVRKNSKSSSTGQDERRIYPIPMSTI